MAGTHRATLSYSFANQKLKETKKIELQVVAFGFVFKIFLFEVPLSEEVLWILLECP